MIFANVRQQFTRDDAQLAVRLVGQAAPGGAEAAESRMRDEGLDALLDDPRLLHALVRSPRGALASWSLFSYVVVRHALQAQGADDRAMASYLAGLMLEFGHRDRAHRIAAHDDEQYDTLVHLLDDVDGPDPRRAFLVRVHLGNYALWVGGLFPDHVEHKRARRGGPNLDYYDEMGQRGFALAATHRLANEHGMSAFFAEAAKRYVAMRVALNSVSDTLLFPNRHSPDRLMRQVRDEARWRFAS